jgi:hypothetical protein
MPKQFQVLMQTSNAVSLARPPSHFAVIVRAAQDATRAARLPKSGSADHEAQTDLARALRGRRKHHVHAADPAD